MEDTKRHLIVVLNDGETYSSVEGSQVMAITEKGLEKLGEGYKPTDLGCADIEEIHQVSEAYE